MANTLLANIDNHNAFVSTLIQECEPLLHSIGLKSFSYNEFRDDSRTYKMLVVDNDYKNHLVEAFENEIDHEFTRNDFAIGSEKYTKILWSAAPDNKLIKFLRSKNIGNGLTVFVPQENSIESFSFGAGVNDTEIQNLYLNDFHLIEQFILYFKEKLRKLESAKKYQPLWTFQNGFKSTFKQQAEMPHKNMLQKKYHTLFRGTQSTLTLRHIQLIGHLSTGKTQKETAREMALSPATIASYADNIKTKFNLHTQSELINLFHSNPLFKSLIK